MKRPDLAILEVNAPTGYIGNLIFPDESRNEKAGDIGYLPLVSDSAAVTNRTDGVAPTAIQISSGNAKFACTEFIKRFNLSYRERAGIGNVGMSDELGSKAAKRSVMKALETAKATKLFTGASVPFVSGQLLATIKNGVKAIKGYAGETALVLSFDAYNKITAMAEITGKLQYNGFNFKKADSILSLDADVLLSMLQGLFGVQKILIGDDDCFAEAGKAVICKLPSADFMSYKAQPELGRTINYLADSEFELDVFDNDDSRNQVFTAIAFADVVEFNAGAKKIIDLEVVVEDSNSASASASESGSGA